MRWVFAVLFLIGFFRPFPARAGEAPASAATKAEAAYAERNDPEKALAAYSLWEETYASSPTVATAWMAARAAHWIGDHSPERRDKLTWFQLGIDWSKKAIAADPASVEGHFWLAGNYGSFGETKGILKSLSLLKPIRAELNEVVRLNDRYDGGGGYRVLGVVDYKVPGIGGGDKKRAAVELEKAYAIDPAHASTLFYLADYWLTMGDRDKARSFLDALDKSASPNVDAVDTESFRRKGAALRAKVK